MQDYSQKLLQCNQTLKDIHKASLASQYEIARKYTDLLKFQSHELSIIFERMQSNAH